MAKKKNICLRDKISGEMVNVKIVSRNKPPKNKKFVSKDVREVIFGKIDGKGKEYAFIIPKRFRKC